MNTIIQEQLALTWQLPESKQAEVGRIIYSMVQEQEEMASMERGLADLAAGRVHTQDEVQRQWDARKAILFPCN
jgi:predicted transcriptional regulator